MTAYSKTSALEEAAKIVEAAGRMLQVEPPSRPDQGCSFVCNGCKFITDTPRAAEDHAIEETARSFPHMLYERMGGTPDGKPHRRVHSPDGRSIRWMRRPT